MSDENCQDAQLTDDQVRVVLEDAAAAVEDYVVFLLRVDDPAEGSGRFSGTGSLVTDGKRFFILTAQHVWTDALADGPAIGVPLISGRGLLQIETSNVVVLPLGSRNSAAWGPDLALLQLGAPTIASIKAYRSFYNLENSRVATLDRSKADESRWWVLMGAPGEFLERTTRGETLGALSIGTDISARHDNADFDYLDLHVGPRDGRKLPSDYRGVSGGPVWCVERHLLRQGDRLFLKERPRLHGVAFYQELDATSAGVIRCHAEKSIYALLNS